MTLKVNEIIKKAEEKGYNTSSTSEYTKPWTQNSILNNVSTENQVLKIDPYLIENWKYHDRNSANLGDIDSLAQEFIQVGQQQPCIVRPLKENPTKYELIIGERRWHAAKKANLKLLVIIKDLDDSTAALAQAAENENRINLSDYEKGLSYTKLIADNIIQQKDLIEKLGKSKQYISALLSFSKIPSEILDAIEDISKFSAISAERVKQITARSELHKQALIAIGKYFKGKSPSAGYIEKEVEKYLSNRPELEKLNKKLLTKDGRHIATWRNDSNNLPALHFPKEIAELLKSDKIDPNELSNEIVHLIESHLKKLRSPS